MAVEIIFAERLRDGRQHTHKLPTPPRREQTCYAVTPRDDGLARIAVHSALSEHKAPFLLHVGRGMLRVEALAPGVHLLPPHVAGSEPGGAAVEMHVLPRTVGAARNFALLRPGDQIWLRGRCRFTVDLAAGGDVQVDSSVPEPLADDGCAHEVLGDGEHSLRGAPGRDWESGCRGEHGQRARSTPQLQTSGKLVKETPALASRHRDAMAAGPGQDEQEGGGAVEQSAAARLRRALLGDSQHASPPDQTCARKASPELGADGDGLPRNAARNAKVADSFCRSPNKPSQRLKRRHESGVDAPEIDEADGTSIDAKDGQLQTAINHTKGPRDVAGPDREDELQGQVTTANDTTTTNSNYMTPLGSDHRATPDQASPVGNQDTTEQSDSPVPQAKSSRKRKTPDSQTGKGGKTSNKKRKSTTSTPHDGIADEEDSQTIVVRPKKQKREASGRATPDVANAEDSWDDSVPADEGEYLRAQTPPDIPPIRMIVSNTDVGSAAERLRAMQRLRVVLVDKAAPGNFDVLVVGNGELKKTYKLLLAFTMGVMITTERWITASIREGAVVNAREFVPDDKPREKLWSFKMSERGPHRFNLFNGLAFHITPALQRDYGAEGFADLNTLLRTAGAAAVSVTPAWSCPGPDVDASGVRHVVVGMEHGDRDVVSLAEQSRVCYSKDLISLSIIRGKLDLDDDEFKITPPASQQEKRRRGRPRMS